MTDPTPNDSASFDKPKHIKYWQRCHSSLLPTPYTSADSQRLLFACFIVSALDLLSVPLSATDRGAIRAWVLSLQHPNGGFCGSSTHALRGQDALRGDPNIAATFFALILLGAAAENEDGARTAFSGVDRQRLLKWLKKLQRPDGSFGQNLWQGAPVGGRDTRHSYLASCIRWMLKGDDSEHDVNVKSMIENLRRGQTYDGGLSEAWQNEPHAGYAYCAVAALAMLDRSTSNITCTSSNTALVAGIPDRDGLLKFLAHRQFVYLAQQEEDDEEEENFIEAKLKDLSLDKQCPHVGYNGRLNKKADTCYCWWTCGALALLDGLPLVATAPSRNYLLDVTQHRIGGFSKVAKAPPDVYHSYLGLGVLALMGEPELKDFDAGLCCSQETTRKIQRAREGLIEAERAHHDDGWTNDGFWD